MNALRWLLLFPSIALGGGLDQNQEVNQSVKTDVAGSQFSSENLVEGSSTRAYAFSYGLGDVDINDCLASVQFGTILFSNQRVKLNKWCAAEIYDAKGLYEMAARMRCDIKEVVKHFQTNQDCVDANTVTPMIFDSEPPPAPVERETCDKECEDGRELVSTLESRVDALESKRESDLQRIESRSRVVEEVNGGITDEQRAALEQVFKK